MHRRSSFVVVTEGLEIDFQRGRPELLLVTTVCALFVAMAVTDSGMYTAYDISGSYTEGSDDAGRDNPRCSDPRRRTAVVRARDHRRSVI